jgi:hypothetical protein
MQQVNPMGSRQLEWHEQREGQWVARVAEYKSVGSKPTYMRFAHVNIRPFHIRHRPGQIFVEFQFYKQSYEQSWHDSMDAAKLHVEAVFALYD